MKAKGNEKLFAFQEYLYLYLPHPIWHINIQYIILSNESTKKKISNVICDIILIGYLDIKNDSHFIALWKLF